jgi:hypothetical protein
MRRVIATVGTSLNVPLDRIIRMPDACSPRIGLAAGRVDPKRVEKFRELLAEDRDALPPLICVRGTYNELLLADGHHRAAAYEHMLSRFPTVPVYVLEAPSDRTAAGYAYEVALEHSAKTSLPLTQAEKRAAIGRLIAERPQASDREIARIVGVSHTTVSAHRAKTGVGGEASQGEPQGGRSGQPPRGQVSGKNRVRSNLRQLARTALELANAEDEDSDELIGQFVKQLPEDIEDAYYTLDWLDWLVCSTQRTLER